MPRATTKQLPIPRFAQDFNAIAQKAGLAVSFATRERNEGIQQLYAVWRGTPKKIMATGVFLRSYRFPLVAGEHRNSMITARVFVDKRVIEAQVYCGVVPKRIEQNGDLEVIHGDGATAYYGTRDALVSAGLCTQKQFPGRRKNKLQFRDWGDKGLRRWECRRHPSGKYLFTLETEHASKERIAAMEAEKRSYEAKKDDRSDWGSPEEWLEFLEDAICMRSLALRKFCTTTTKAGMRYSINPASLESILSEIETAAQRIRAIPVNVQSLEPRGEIATPETRDKAASASHDALFQRFMGRLLPGGKEAGNHG